MAYVNRKGIVENNYRRVEAMWRKGNSINFIVNSTDLTKLEVLDTVQKIFYLDERRSIRAAVL
mgnify:CR=1 FL=1